MAISPESEAHSAASAYFRCWNQNSFELLDGLLTAEWIDHSHPDRRNAADVRRAFADARIHNPSTQVRIDAVLGRGDLVEVHGRIVDEEREESRVWIIRAVDGRLHEMWTRAVD